MGHEGRVDLKRGEQRGPLGGLFLFTHGGPDVGVDHVRIPHRCLGVVVDRDVGDAGPHRFVEDVAIRLGARGGADAQRHGDAHGHP